MRKAYFFLLLACQPAMAQLNSIYNFNATQIHNVVYMSFTIRLGNTCADTHIQRSNDSLSFHTIGTIPGICGSISSDESYSFVDSFPMYGTANYYRIYLGNQGYSYTVRVDVIAKRENAVLIYPNPTTDQIHVQFQSSASSLNTFLIRDLKGRIYVEPAPIINSKTIDISQWNSGIYVLQIILSEGIRYEQQFVIAR